MPNRIPILFFLIFGLLFHGYGENKGVINPSSTYSLDKTYLSPVKASQNKDITTALPHLPEYSIILKNIPKAKRRFLSKQQIPEPGVISNFFVRNILNFSKWDTVSARAVAVNASYTVWIDTNVVGTLIDSTEISSILDSLHYALLEHTSGYSVNPGAGIFDILRNYFGNPPDIDGDGRIDILLLDIRDQFETTGSYVAGFFDPNDLSENQYSNQRDLLYIDLYPTIKYQNNLTVENAVATITHEMQHLIHANYEGPEPEYIFIPKSPK